MIYTITGKNTFAMRRKIDEIVASFIKKYGDLAVEKFDGDEDEFQTILDAAQSLPFLVERKLIVLRNASANKDLAEHVEQIIDSISENVDLIFYEPATDKRTTFYKTLKSKTQFEEFAELDPHRLASWLVEEAKVQQAELSLADAAYMVQRLGQSQQLLASELDKLVTYDLQITRQNIDLLTEPTPQSKIFDLLDAAFGGQKKNALRLYAEQRAQKVEPAAILAMLAWQLNILTLCKLAGDRRPEQIAKDAGLSPFPVLKASSLARKITDEQLKRLVNDTLEIDYKTKTSAYDLDEALKTFIITI